MQFQLLLEGPGTIDGMPSVGNLSKGSLPAFMSVYEKTAANYKAQSEIEPATSRVPVLSTEPLRHCWGLITSENLKVPKFLVLWQQQILI